jgi:predicted nucleotidyltransferase
MFFYVHLNFLKGTCMSAVIEFSQHIANRLSEIEGVAAVVLGGSQARGDAHPNSDIDLAIYYDPQHPPSLAALRTLAAELDDQHRADAVTDFGGWGPWINGGAWLDIQGQRVDWLYRDLARVAHEIAECEAGRPVVHYQAGHPHGFWNHIYMGEVFYCRVLAEKDSTLSLLKTRANMYPPLLKKALINNLWEANFSLENCHKPAARGDVTHVAGYLYRAAAVMTQALFALNERYCINEKGAVKLSESFPLHPHQFSERVAQGLAHIGASSDDLNASVHQFETLLQEVRALCDSQAQA